MRALAMTLLLAAGARADESRRAFAGAFVAIKHDSLGNDVDAQDYAGGGVEAGWLGRPWLALRGEATYTTIHGDDVRGRALSLAVGPQVLWCRIVCAGARASVGYEVQQRRLETHDRADDLPLLEAALLIGAEIRGVGLTAFGGPRLAPRHGTAFGLGLTYAW